MKRRSKALSASPLWVRLSEYVFMHLLVGINCESGAQMLRGGPEMELLPFKVREITHTPRLVLD